MSEFSILIALSSKDYDQARVLFKEYAASLDFDLCFQDFETELDEIAIQYGKPNGGIILAIDNLHKPIGCCGIRKFGDEIGELKRMYVKPEYRNKGLGKKLLKEAIDLAKQLNYHSIRLDTVDSMAAAIHLYEKFGFKEIPEYRFNPEKGPRFYELKLD